MIFGILCRNGEAPGSHAGRESLPGPDTISSLRTEKLAEEFLSAPPASWPSP